MDHQNNYVENSSMSNTIKNFDILATNLIVYIIYNYFDVSANFKSVSIEFFTSAKLYFLCTRGANNSVL